MSTIRDYDYNTDIESSLIHTRCYDTINISHIGGFNENHIRPHIVTSAMINSDDTLALLSTSTQRLIQIFRIPENNIYKLTMLGAIDSFTSSTLDTMDYLSSATLQSVWVANTAARVQCWNDKTIKNEGSSSMRLTTGNVSAATFYVQKDLGATGTDFSTLYSGFKFSFRKDTQLLTIRLTVVDINGTAANSLLFGVSNNNI